MIIFSKVTGFATVQDHGRIGLAHLAIPTSGAFDRESHDLANRIVGNSREAATIESLRANLTFTTSREIVIAVTGAPANVVVNGIHAQMNAATYIPAQASIEISTTQLAMRTYVAIRGGFQGEVVIGSQSYDELSRLGTPPITVGSTLEIARHESSDVLSAHAVIKGVRLDSHFVASVSPGPRWDMFPEFDELFRKAFMISSQCNRVAVRLEGYSFAWDTSARLPSEGVVFGAIQVPVDGFPLIFGPDHPTTGGYPVIGVVAQADMSVIAQLPPGTTLGFRRRSS